MTKQHFKALANALKATKPPRYDGSAQSMQWRDCVIAVTEVCASFNTAFKKGKFLAACGLPNILDK